MTKPEYFKFQEQWFAEIQALTVKKNADYTGSGDNPFKNFEHVGTYNPAWVLVGFFTRMSDKFARVASYIENGKFEVEDEGIFDTLKDLSNYPCLMAGYLMSKQPESIGEVISRNQSKLAKTLKTLEENL